MKNYKSVLVVCVLINLAPYILPTLPTLFLCAWPIIIALLKNNYLQRRARPGLTELSVPCTA